jgi:EAL domain-containing protein (putative c-di-GMP-specific phosphodiesterase class I)
LGEAIGADRLALAYQPIVEAATGHIAALEALARWYHPVLGSISPEQFVRLAEETDRIVALGDWVLRKACENAITWVHSEHIPKVAVNVSVKQLLADDFIPRVEQILGQSGLPAARLELEVTESLFNDENMSIVLSAVKALRTIGIQVHIDDFGTGYSSLSRLHQFPVSAIKIDRSFVAEMHRQGRVIIESTVLIACSFDFKVIAEGVETLEQARSLYAMGIDYFQGYYFSRPTQEARLEKYLPDWHDTIVS